VNDRFHPREGGKVPHQGPVQQKAQTQTAKTKDSKKSNWEEAGRQEKLKKQGGARGFTEEAGCPLGLEEQKGGLQAGGTIIDSPTGEKKTLCPEKKVQVGGLRTKEKNKKKKKNSNAKKMNFLKQGRKSHSSVQGLLDRENQKKTKERSRGETWMDVATEGRPRPPQHELSGETRKEYKAR